jgi:hypothetical protein
MATDKTPPPSPPAPKPAAEVVKPPAPEALPAAPANQLHMRGTDDSINIKKK